MTTQTEGQAEGQQQDKGGEGGDYGKPPTMGDLRAMVADTVESALKPIMDKIGGGGSAGPTAGQAATTTGGGATAPSPAGDASHLSKLVDEALAKVLGDQDKQKAEDLHRKQHEVLAAAAERTPVDRPRRSRWLGSIWDDN